VTILLLSDVFPPRIGGSGRWLWELHRRLNGHEVHVVTDEASGAAEFDAAAGLPIHRVPLRFIDWGISDPRAGVQYARSFLRLSRLVARIRPDVIHCGKCLPEGLLASIIKLRQGTPFSCFAHGEELTLAETSLELRWLTRHVAVRARSIVANTSHTKKILIRTAGVLDDRVLVLPPGVDATLFKPAPPDPIVRARLGWTNRRVVLTVGALVQRKGQDMMIRALPEVRRHCPDVLYVIVGEGADKPRMEALVDEHRVGDLVQFRTIPGDAELIQCYQQCDLFALPNRQVGWDFEGFGIVLIEAQACGKPVIAGLSGGTAEAMEPGQTGELIDCEAPEELARAVSALLGDPRRRAALGDRARQRVLERFDWPVLARQADALFTGFASGHWKNPRQGD
jgi:phosphatidylinositol alpha-1,6-mannosyltransferase